MPKSVARRVISTFCIIKYIIIRKEGFPMKSISVKSTNMEPGTITKLEEKIIKLQHKILQLDTMNLKQEQKIIRLQVENKNLKAENNKLKEEITLPANIHKVIAAIRKSEHNDLLKNKYRTIQSSRSLRSG
jgi:cell shape-determining protein MreC